MCRNDIIPAIRFLVGKSNQESVNKDWEVEAEHFQDVCIIDLCVQFCYPSLISLTSVQFSHEG